MDLEAFIFCTALRTLSSLKLFSVTRNCTMPSSSAATHFSGGSWSPRSTSGSACQAGMLNPKLSPSQYILSRRAGQEGPPLKSLRASSKGKGSGISRLPSSLSAARTFSRHPCFRMSLCAVRPPMPADGHLHYRRTISKCIFPPHSESSWTPSGCAPLMVPQ